MITYYYQVQSVTTAMSWLTNKLLQATIIQQWLQFTHFTVVLAVEMKIKVIHHNNLRLSVTERVEKVWEPVQEHFVCIFELKHCCLQHMLQRFRRTAISWLPVFPRMFSWERQDHFHPRLFFLGNDLSTYAAGVISAFYASSPCSFSHVLVRQKSTRLRKVWDIIISRTGVNLNQVKVGRMGTCLAVTLPTPSAGSTVGGGTINGWHRWKCFQAFLENRTATLWSSICYSTIQRAVAEKTGRGVRVSMTSNT